MLISIITVNYNNLEALKKTIKSVKNQTYQEFEYIVIDGNSQDGGADYINNNKNLFDYCVSEPDNGVYHAMNKGIEKASGEYLLFLNSGDHFFNKKVLKKYIEQIDNYDLVYFNQQVIGKTKTFLKEYPDELSFAYFLKDNLPHQATFINKKLFKKVGLFNEDFKIVADWKFFIDAVCKYNVSYKHVDKALVVFYQDGISAQVENTKVIYDEKQAVLQSSYLPFMQDLDDILKYKTIINNLRRSKKIKWLIKLGLINKF